MEIVSEVYLKDCIEGMKHYPDNYFDLAVVDPPYGIDFGNYNRTNKTATGERYKANKYKVDGWDKSIPTEAYFLELFRVSREQIIWGGNYFPLPPTQGFIFWYKQNPVSNFSDGELAWTSLQRPAKCFNYKYFGNIQGNTKADNKIYPTQKPIELYDWIYKNYSEPNFKILDTHLGSGSSRIAAYKAKLHFVGFEIDKEYFDNHEKRFKEFTSQLTLF